MRKAFKVCYDSLEDRLQGPIGAHASSVIKISLIRMIVTGQGSILLGVFVYSPAEWIFKPFLDGHVGLR